MCSNLGFLALLSAAGAATAGLVEVDASTPNSSDYDHYRLGVVASAAASGVVEVNASTFSPADYDAVLDVRNLDEFVGNTSAADCSIGPRNPLPKLYLRFGGDPMGCLYGHVPGAIWMPQLYLCGGVVPGNTCPQAQQLLADARTLGGKAGEALARAGAALGDFAPLLDECRPLRIAFICHSGVRSLKAADDYAQLMQALYGQVPAGSVVSVAGGTQLWYRSQRPTDFGPEPAGPRTCEQLSSGANAVAAVTV